MQLIGYASMQKIELALIIIEQCIKVVSAGNSFRICYLSDLKREMKAEGTVTLLDRHAPDKTRQSFSRCIL